MSDQVCPVCGEMNPSGVTTCQACGSYLSSSPVTSGPVSVSPGDVLQDRYEIRDIIHAGSTSYVYLAQDRQSNDNPCIIKQIRNPVRSIDQRRKLDIEAQEMARLNHPGIVKVLAHFIENDSYFLVEEYIPGKTLGEIFKERQGQLTETEVVIWAMSVLDILEYIHQEGLTHRNINPDSIMLTPDGSIKFTDFSTQIDVENYTPGKMEGTGRFGFTPPEQWQGKVEPRSDLFALAATIFYLLSGFLPLSREYLNGQGPQTVDYYPQFPPIRTINPGISTGLEDVLKKALQINVDNRYSSPDEFRLALLNTSGQVVSAAPSKTATAAVRQPVARPVPVIEPSRKSSSVKMAAILLPVICLVGLVVFLILDSLNPGSSSANVPGNTTLPTISSLPITTVPVTGTTPPASSLTPSVSPEVPSPPEAVFITTGVVRQDFNTPGEEHLYYFESKAGDYISLTLTDMEGPLFVSLTLEDADGNEIRSASDTNIAVINYQLTADGVYFVRVKDDNDPLQTGPYSLSFDSVKNTKGSTITSASSVTDRLTVPGEARYYSFSGKRGELVYITLADSSNSLYPSLTLFDPKGVIEESALDDRVSEIVTRLQSTGTYKIRVSDGGAPLNTGKFTLSFNKVMDNKSTWIASGPALKGEFTSPGEVHYFTFNAKEGDYITITAADASGSMTMDLTLLTLGGTLISSVTDDDIAEIYTRIESTGTYIIRIRDNSTPLQAGFFTLSFNNFTDKIAELIKYGVTVKLDMSLPGEVREFYFEGKKDENLVITFTGSSPSTKVSVRLVYTDGREIQLSSGHNNGIIRYQMPAVDAIHYIQVRDDSSPVQSGTYYLSVTKV